VRALATSPETPASPAAGVAVTERPAASPQSAPVTRQAAAPALRNELAQSPPVFNAAYLRNPPPRYPPAARRLGSEGTVMLRVLVSAEGLPVRVELEQTSGSSPLDRAALDAVRGWRFAPARRGEQNIEDWVRVPIVFRLES
ncbi:MAG: energy transducer TonB, partial [Betaproteobacteria bacterium]|nr:energy transducer TonB [Betaproteobacteria bacterium]